MGYEQLELDAVLNIRSVSSHPMAPLHLRVNPGRCLASCTLLLCVCVKFDFDTNLPAPEEIQGVPKKNPRGDIALQVLARRTTPAAAAAASASSHTRRLHIPATLACHPHIHPMTTAAQVGPPPAPLLLGPVLGTLPPDLFHTEVQRRLGPRALASLAQASRGCAAAVAATALMSWAEHEKMAVAGRLFHLLPLCVKEACTHAAFCGNREVLEWLHNTGCPWDTITCRMAARGGHLEVLQWARENGCPWGAYTGAFAAQWGHLRVLQWARKHGSSWDAATPAWAAEGGHLAVLQWAQEHQCPWDWRSSQYATREGKLEVLQWVRENDATGEVWYEEEVRLFAAGPRKQEILTWLDELNAT